MQFKVKKSMRTGPSENDEFFASEDEAFAVFMTIFDRLVASGGGRGRNADLQRYVADPAHAALEERMVAAVVAIIERSDSFYPIMGALCAYNDVHEGVYVAGQSVTIRTAISSGNPYIYVMRLFWNDSFNAQLSAEGFPVDSHVRERVVSIEDARTLKIRILENI